MELKIMGPVRLEKNPINKYRLHVNAMSGDADSYEINIMDLDDLDVLLKYVKILGIRWYMKGDIYSDSSVNKAIEEKSEELGMEDARDLYSDLVGYDVTSQGQYASCEDIKVTYFDSNGIEHNVLIIVGDKTYTVIDERAFR